MGKSLKDIDESQILTNHCGEVGVSRMILNWALGYG
jgi:hypothetical protein